MLRVGSIRRLKTAGGVVLACGVLVAGCGRHAPEPGGEGSAAAPPAASRVERGKYLVTILACNDCHTPLQMGPSGPQPDMSRMLSGHPESLRSASASRLSTER